MQPSLNPEQWTSLLERIDRLSGEVNALRVRVEQALPIAPPPETTRRPRARRWAIRLGILLLLVAALFLTRSAWLAGYANLFRVDNPVAGDVLVLLLGGVDHRPAGAARLYHEGIAPRILLCTSDVIPGTEQVLSQSIKARLIKDGVPDEAVTILPGVVASTQDEAVRVKVYVADHPIRRLTIVTTSFHTARARWIFQRTLGVTGVDVRAAAIDDPRFNESNWYRKEEGLIAYFNETVKIFYYFLKY